MRIENPIFYKTPWGEEAASCPHCGSDLSWVDCENCEDGYSDHDCGEDCCCCLDPQLNVVCDICREKVVGIFALVHAATQLRINWLMLRLINCDL
jgi:hypothetical protein